jgi:SAM domain (Sterile alpha motif)
MDVGGWLRRLGLEQYEAAFRENKIDGTVLPSLTAEDLKDLGVGFVGHRRKLLDAIAALRAEATQPAPPSDAPLETDKAARDTAERRQVASCSATLSVRRRSPLAWTPKTCARSFLPIRNAWLRPCAASMGS